MKIIPRLTHLIVGVTLLTAVASRSSAQTLEWVIAVGTGNADRANAVTTDNTGNVYVAGSTSGTFAGQSSAGSADAYVARFDASGNMQWVRQFGTSGSDGIASADTDSAGFVYVAGISAAQAFLAKYDSTGNQQWSRLFSVAGYGTAQFAVVAADGAGNTYQIGTITDPAVPPPVAGPGWFLTKYDAEGTRLWIRWAESPTLIPSAFYDVATDAAGHVFVLSLTRAPSPSSFDRASLQELDPEGNRVWGAGYGGDFHTYFYDVATDELGNVYLGGRAIPRSGGGGGPFLIRYDAARTKVWEQPLASDVGDLAADARGVYVAIGNSLAMHDPDGSRLWDTSVIYGIANVAVVNSGPIYLAVNGCCDSGAYLAKVTNPAPTVDQYYEIVSRNSDKCLDVYGASMDAVAPVIQWMCHGGDNQQWALEPAGGGAFRIIARHSGQALDVYGAWLEDVTPAIQYPWHGGDNQLWTIEPTSEGYVRIVARHSGKVLDVEGGSLSDGAQVIQYAWHGGANQQWVLRPVTSAPPSSTAVSSAP